MDFELFNTYSNKTELFIPLDDNDIRIYACGPTVYDYIHVGNARPLIIFDVLVRFLKLIYPKVTYVRNITDVDDKIIVQANQNKESINNLTERTIKAFSDDADALFVKKPDFEPRATEHIQEMLKMIKVLLESGNAYLSDGHVLFSVSSMPNYGKLSGMNLSEMIDGARVEVSDYKKEPADFVLWKPSKTGELGWHSDFGFGRPGWHIECSAMSEKYLGKQFDIHAGGLDLIFPHHENEIAQSKCSFDQEFANYWIHSGLLKISGEKMSKSLGNFARIKDLLKIYHPEVIKFFLISSHYRSALDFTNESLEQAKAGLVRIYESIDEKIILKESDEVDKGFVQDFECAMNDDLNTPKAISILFEIVKKINLENDNLTKRRLVTTLKKLANIIGLLSEKPELFFQYGSGVDTQLIEEMILKRNLARKDKDFDKADEIRDELKSLGIILDDKADGTKWKKV